MWILILAVLMFSLGCASANNAHLRKANESLRARIRRTTAAQRAQVTVVEDRIEAAVEKEAMLNTIRAANCEGSS